jgi:hypothetical protein
MLSRVLLVTGWILPCAVLLLFLIKGQFYNPAFFAPPVSEAAALPMPASLGGWVLESGMVLPADRMFEKINGKASYYLQYGAVELGSGEWVADGRSWDMYLYRFETEQGARGAYNGERPSDGTPVEGVDGYTVPGQAALTVGTYYLQLNSFTAGADAAPAVELAMLMTSHLDKTGEGQEEEAVMDLLSIAGADAAGDAEGFVPENAFGFSVLGNVRTVEVALDGISTTWFTLAGDAGTVEAYAEELSMFGGEEIFRENGVAGGAMFGSWSVAGVFEQAVWGVHNAPTRESLLQHWGALTNRIGEGADSL